MVIAHPLWLVVSMRSVVPMLVISVYLVKLEVLYSCHEYRFDGRTIFSSGKANLH